MGLCPLRVFAAGLPFAAILVRPDARLSEERLVFRSFPEDEASDPDKDDAASFSDPYNSRKARPTGIAFFLSTPLPSPDALADTADD